MTSRVGGRSPAGKIWLIGTIAWAAMIAWQAWSRWPALPLDMSASDPDIQAAYDVAIGNHVVRALILGAAGPGLLYGLIRLIFGRGDRRDISKPGALQPGPRRILLMRHAEKTGDPKDIHLSRAGVVRAERLVQYIPETFGRPDFIFAAARSKRSIRSIETMQPLATSLGLQVDHGVEDKDFGMLIERLQSDPMFRGSTVVICWHHGKLPEIAAALGAPRGSYPDPWDDKVFNLVVDLTYGADSEPATTHVTEPF